MKRSAAVNDQPARGNLSSKVPPQATRLERDKSISVAKLPSRISPPKASEFVLTPTTASGRVVPQTRQASNPGLRRQETIYIPRTKENGSQGSKENGMFGLYFYLYSFTDVRSIDGDKGQNDGEDGQSPAAPNDDDGDKDKDEQENRDNRSSNGEDEEEDAEAERIKAERVAAYNAKKANKPKTIAKVSYLLFCSWHPHYYTGSLLT